MSSAAENPFPVVGVGASAGGLGALTQLVGALPAHPGLSLVVVQHLDPHAESHLATLLKSHTPMEVLEATHGMKMAPDRIYVIQPNTSVALVDGVLSVTARPDDRRPHYPVDHFMRSLATVQGPHAVGVILSGTGSDGTLGVCEIKAAGGVTFAQDEASAQYPGMPHSAVSSGAVDLILPPQEIAARLATLPQHPVLSGAQPPEHVVDNDEQFLRVIAALRATSGVDFSQYRDTTIKRRTARRMVLRGFKSPAEYAQYLERDRTEAEALYRDVLINVTSFFRDPEMFDDLKTSVFPEILKTKRDAEPIRVWVAGCSTGQEAYSVAIALIEFLDRADTKCSIQIFATDLGDPASLERARAGVYPESIETEVSPERLRRFFTKEDRSYRIQKSIRDACIFARQNITVDPPFSRVDLVTCRNVLIYMSPRLQDRLLPIFHFALNRGGFLVLGMAETIGHFDELFDVITAEHKIYRRKDTQVRPQLAFMADEWLAGAAVKPGVPLTQTPADFQREANRLALGRYAPPSVLVNLNFEIQQFRGKTTPFLQAPAGQPTTNILRMAGEGLFMELRSALSEAKTTKAPVVCEHLRIQDGGHEVEFTLRILPVTVAQASEFRLLVLFEARDQMAWTPAWSAGPGASAATNRDVDWLRQELAATKQYLQSIVDEQDGSNQQLRAAHEEVLSSNEELQSTNEELETTKEELQASNEELTTVNEQFQNRNRELDALADDLSNFIASADLPMVTVGRDLIIRRLTPAALSAFHLLQSDVGRSIAHINFSLKVEQVGAIIEGVIASAQPWEREVTDAQGRWWMLRVRPFLTLDGRVDGATLVAVDVDLITRGREILEARDYALAVVQTVREPLVVLAPDGRVEMANGAFYELFGETPETSTGHPLWDTGRGTWSDAAIRRSLLNACRDNTAIVNLEIQRSVPGRGVRTLVLNARGIVREGASKLLLLAIEDVTDARQAEALRIDAETLRLVDRRKDEFLGVLAHELRNPLAPMRFALEIMRRGDGSAADTARPRQVLERQVAHMVRIVDDLLDVSRITQGKVELRREAVDLWTIVQGAVELSRPAIDGARHMLTLSLPDERVTLNADPVRLTQVLVNLLNNAVKFTAPGGHIWLIAERTGEDPAHPDQVRIRVRDTGIGIAPEMRPKIFDMFMQGDRSLERTRGGLGVGLTLVRNLVALHGGNVEARSEGTGQGSEFIVTLPILPVSQADADQDEPSGLHKGKPRRVLVADDNEDGRELLGFLLRADGHAVVTAADGAAAVAAAAEFHPDVAILDIGMPGLSGYDVAERLRATAGGAPLLLIALSGLGQQEDKARANQAGFDFHFTKPVDTGALTALLAGME